MTWQHQRMPAHVQLLGLPDDGVALSNHPLGWVGTRWGALMDRQGADGRDRVLRGRNYARRGRLRALDIGPGTATAEVFCEQVFKPTLRARPFTRAEWTTIVETLAQHLDLLAALLEGELPQALVARLEALGVSLLPKTDELGFDCDCGDYVMPCTHAATVFHVVGDALDGDPFLLLTVRGRSREQLLAALRAGWGDEAALVDAADRTEEPPPESDWLTAPGGVPDFSCSFSGPPTSGAGLRALGPPPGEADLLPTLLPIYEGGYKVAVATVDAIPDRPHVRRRPRVEELPVEVLAATSDPAAVATDSEPESAAADDGLTDRLVAAIGGQDGATSQELATALGTTVSRIREALVDLVEFGIVYRTRDDDTVRWWLG